MKKDDWLRHSLGEQRSSSQVLRLMLRRNRKGSEPYKVLYFVMYVGTSTNPPAGLIFADTETNPVVSSTGNNQNNANAINKKYCSKCGSVIDQDNKICTGCGKQYFKGIKYYISALLTKKHRGDSSK